MTWTDLERFPSVVTSSQRHVVVVVDSNCVWHIFVAIEYHQHTLIDQSTWGESWAHRLSAL